MTTLDRLAAEQRGFFFRWQALDLGYSEDEVADRLLAGEWVRLRHGTYARAADATPLSAAERHVLVARSVAAKLSGQVVLSHYSSLALQGVPLWGVDLDVVHVHRGCDGWSRRQAGIVHHVGTLTDDLIREVDGVLVIVPEQAVLAVARLAVTFEAAVVLMDGARRELAFDMDLAERLQLAQRDWSGAPRSGRALRFSDPRAESVGESRTRVLMDRLCLPTPDLQRKIFGASGQVVARTDLYIDLCATAVEFDGKQKYGRALYEREGTTEVDLAAVLWREKRREDELRDLGHQVVRVVWSELDGHDCAVRQRFERAFARSRRSAG